MSEGLIQGLIGSLLAAAVVYGLHVVLNNIGNPVDPSLLTQMRLTGWQVFWTDVVVVLVGAVIGSSARASPSAASSTSEVPRPARRAARSRARWSPHHVAAGRRSGPTTPREPR